MHHQCSSRIGWEFVISKEQFSISKEQFPLGGAGDCMISHMLGFHDLKPE